ncbi:hypothetical protein ACLMJK_002607 [Lecanora helva]
MTSPQPNPRRCYKTKGAPAFAPFQPTSTLNNVSQNCTSTESSAQALRKSSTFHSPKSPSSDDDPILNIPLLSRRSPTCPKDLEDAVAASEQRIGQLIGSVDRSLSGLESFSTDSQETVRPDDLPVPRFMLGNYQPAVADHMDVDSNDAPSTPATKHRPTHNRHSSDSGLGSSVSSTEESLSGRYANLNVNALDNTPSSARSEVRSGINGAIANTHAKTQHALSSYACKQIQDHIITPILREGDLKSFHPLISSIPYRVGKKEITCLRDLEKVVLWLAPCLHTTVEYLNDSDRQRPTDRPYTNGYFLDLTEQVRQYAAMITAARERIASGRPSREDDYSSDERLSLHGGLGKTDRAAELVRIKNGQAISLRTGEVVDPENTAGGMKRSTSSGPEDDLLHSMARRKKTEAERAKQIQRCSECDKEFKRPCDLTKHEKTHSRPWKCNEPTCKYSQYGWPTEKERDRHVNDKHSVTPSMFKCQFHPCPYESKRESNCKQHMEKAHGWAYVRSKNNGKSAGKKPAKNAKTPPTPQTTTPGSHIFSASSSDFGEATSPHSTRASLSPYLQNGYTSNSVNGSAAENSSNYESPALGMTDSFTPWNPTFNYEGSYNGLTPQSSYNPSPHRISLDSIPTVPSSYGMQGDPTLFDENYDWNNMDFTSLNIQLDTTTPLTTNSYSRNPSISIERPQSTKNPNLSPGAQGNEMLFSPYTNEVLDEGYGDFTTGKPANDFALFDDSRPASSLGNGAVNLFSDLPPFQPTTWSDSGSDLAQQYGMNDMMPFDEE